MSFRVSVILLLASISSKVAGQCDYVYVAQPPSPELICDPHLINQLRLVCSIFVADISQPDTLTIQWIFGAPTADRQFDPNNLLIFREVNFTVAPLEIFTSRIVVASPPIGYYICLPRLTSGRRLINSNIVPLQPQSIYQLSNTRPCLPDEFQNTSIPSCAVPGATIDPSQILAPVPTIIDTLQFITPTAVDLVTPTALLEVQQTPVATATEAVPDNFNARLIAGVTVGSIAFVIVALIVVLGIVIACQARKNKTIPVTFDNKGISLTKFDVPQTINTEQGDEGKFVPPNKPPPTLLSRTLTTSHHYSRLIRSRPKIGKNSERSASGSELDYTDGGIEYYVEFDDERMENPYVDESESLVCTDARYGAESDFYLQQQQQQQQKQRKQQSFVRSSSLELESDKEGTHTREATDTVNSINPMVNSPQHVYQNWVPKSEYDNVRLKPTLKKAKHETWSTSYDQETTDTRELETEYANAEILENTAI